jgi:disulfide bond formation protein DsbB
MATPAPVASAQATTPVAAVALDPQAVTRGKKAYVSCMACDGKDAKGVKNMGKGLIGNPFITGQSDDALMAFIKKGRGPTDPGNTTKVAMPPKGGNPAMKDEQIRDIVTYIRSLQPGSTVASASAAPAKPATPAAPVASASPSPVAPPTPAPVPAPVAAASPAPKSTPAPTKSAIASAGDPIARGKKAYMSCLACHGKDGTGVKNMGKDLVNSPFVAGLSDDALVDFIKKGRGPTDPGNTTKIAMPPKGGNPALKDEQIRDIVAYLRSLRQQSASAE